MDLLGLEKLKGCSEYSFASLSAASLPGIPECPGIQTMLQVRVLLILFRFFRIVVISGWLSIRPLIAKMAARESVQIEVLVIFLRLLIHARAWLMARSSPRNIGSSSLMVPPPRLIVRPWMSIIAAYPTLESGLFEASV